ncbi:right-handed parallel beta-helix repeat-containing protein [Halopiger thermotolerans]
MTTTEETRSKPDERTLVGRRSYLKAAASAVALALTGAGSAAAAGEDYDVIEVPAGETHTIALGDGDTLENTLIDISARNATFQISAQGSGWEVRNLGIRGNWDETQKAEPFVVSGDGVVDNYYFADGATGDTYPNGPTGIYVANDHSGTIRINNVNIQDLPDNAIYGSSPGDLPQHSLGAGGGGDVIITNSYAANCVSSSFRVGTDGSRVENCVSVGSDCGFWAFYNAPKAVNCDFSDSDLGDVRVGDGQWQDDARPRLENVRYETDVVHSGSIDGSSAGAPQRTSPEEVEGVPLSAEEAASGGGSDGSDTDSSEGTDETEPAERLLAFVTEPDARFAGYEFAADGPVEFAEAPYESPSGGRIEGGTYAAEDFIEEADDGTIRAGGVTGGGHGDAFRVRGPVTSIDIDQSDAMWVELDGEEMTVEDVLEATSA